MRLKSGWRTVYYKADIFSLQPKLRLPLAAECTEQPCTFIHAITFTLFPSHTSFNTISACLGFVSLQSAMIKNISGKLTCARRTTSEKAALKHCYCTLSSQKHFSEMFWKPLGACSLATWTVWVEFAQTDCLRPWVICSALDVFLQVWQVSPALSKKLGAFYPFCVLEQGLETCLLHTHRPSSICSSNTNPDAVWYIKLLKISASACCVKVSLRLYSFISPAVSMLQCRTEDGKQKCPLPLLCTPASLASKAPRWAGRQSPACAVSQQSTDQHFAFPHINCLITANCAFNEHMTLNRNLNSVKLGYWNNTDQHLWPHRVVCTLTRIFWC